MAVNKNFILLSEDAVLRKVAEEKFAVSGVRLFDLIEHFEKQAIIDNIQATQFKARLIRFNQTYVPGDHNILIFLFREAEYSVSDPGFQKGLFFLGPVSDLSGVINVVADFLIEIFQNKSLLLYNKQMVTHELLNKTSIGRDENPQQIAYKIIQSIQIRTRDLPILQNEIRNYIVGWLKNKIY